MADTFIPLAIEQDALADVIASASLLGQPLLLGQTPIVPTALLVVNYKPTARLEVVQ
jgi:hypothetical protein